MNAWTCDRCKQPKTELPWGIRTPFGPQLVVCADCYRAMRRAYEQGRQAAIEAQEASIPEIPENCEYRFLFALWYWHHRRGMAHSRLANRVVMNSRLEARSLSLPLRPDDSGARR